MCCSQVGTERTSCPQSSLAVGRGEAIFSPALAQRLIDFFAAPHSVIPPQFFPELTDREREILLLIAQGYNNSDIARRLTLSQKTVANLSNLFSKLQVADRAQAIIRAREAGWGQDKSCRRSLAKIHITSRGVGSAARQAQVERYNRVLPTR
jgi:DNA-binding NarL/FixJ family response regulator